MHIIYFIRLSILIDLIAVIFCNMQDSGGFQMVSLLKLAEITEEGVKFQSPHDGREMLLTPEKSTEIQNSIGADIIMQLDDVVSSTTTGDMLRILILL